MRSQMRVPYLLLFSQHMVGLPQDFPVENTQALRAGSNANLLPTSSFEGQWTSNRIVGKVRRRGDPAKSFVRYCDDTFFEMMQWLSAYPGLTAIRTRSPRLRWSEQYRYLSPELPAL